MYTYHCTQCGCAIHVDSNTVECICEACGTEFTAAQLSERQELIEQLRQRVHDEVYADEENKRLREESDAKRHADENENKTKQEEANIKLTEAEAELRKAQIRAANAEAANAGKAKTIIVNGPNTAELGENAVKAFVAKDFQNAFTAADTVLATDKDHVGAYFIKSYKEYVVNKRPSGLDGFIAKITNSSYAIADADLFMLEDLLATTPERLKAFEKQILTFVYHNSVGDPAKEASACKFVDSFSPAIIASRSDHTFLTAEMIDLYGKLAEFCTIPKTCHTLICSINANPESPIKSGRFYLKSVSEKFYKEYVIPIGGIVGKMKSQQYRAKFSDAYEKYKLSFVQKAGI